MINRQKASIAACVILLVGWSGRLQQPAPSAVSASPSSCEAREARQFDFWVGDWYAFDVAGPVTPVARVRVDRILDGCVLREDYQDTNGLRGQSFSVYDAGNKRWHQTWVTNRGQLLLLDGDLQGEEMIFRGKDRTADGKERSVRGTWRPTKEGVRETATRSMDDGKTWEPWFDILFRPHK